MPVAVPPRPRARHALLPLACAGALLTATMAPAAQARPAAATPGGTITVRDNGVPDCLDPQKTALGPSFEIFDTVFDTLVSVSPKGQIVPYLATHWTFADGGKQVTFSLRHGVRFSNGDPLDANAVKFTFDRALNPATKSPATAAALSSIQSTQVVDPYTVRVTLKSPYRPLLTQLAVSYEGILDPVAVKAEGDGYCQKPVGSGPFMIQSVGPGFNSVTLVRNPYHTYEPSWASNQGAAYLDKLVFKPIVSDATATSELLSGGLDISTVSGPQLPRVKGNAAVVQHRVPTQDETYLGFNFAHAPFNNPDVRRAVAEAIDRTALIKAAVNGLGVPAYSPVPPTLPYYDPTSKSYAPQYNVSDAQRIISANHATGPYTLLIIEDPAQSAAAELIQAELQQVGMNVSIVTKPIADYVPAGAKGQFDMNLLNWGYPDPDLLYDLFDSSQAVAGGLNFTNYKSATLDNLLAQSRATTDSKAAAQIFAKIQRFMDTNTIIDPLWTDVTVTGVRSRVKGFQLNRAGGDPLYQDLYLG